LICLGDNTSSRATLLIRFASQGANRLEEKLDAYKREMGLAVQGSRLIGLAQMSFGTSGKFNGQRRSQSATASYAKDSDEKR
jgi:hypothetical protein